MPITRSMTRARAATTVRGAPGNLRCVCTELYVGARDQLLQCTECNNWLHPLCVGIANTAVAIADARPTYVCPYCMGTFRKRLRRETVKLVEVPDRTPTNRAALELAVTRIRASLRKDGYEALEFPDTALTDAMVDQTMACCSTAIADLTFSDSYPRYCLREQQQRHHAYLQGCAARPATSGAGSSAIVSVVLSNGMDPYSNLRQVIASLRSQVARNAVKATAVTDAAVALDGTDDFVHHTLIVTHDDHRGKHLAQRLLLLDMARWCLRGRTRSFLNMALEKRVVDDKLVCSVATAPRKLYAHCDFTEVCEHVDAAGNPAWTKREEDVGRVLVNLDMPATVLRLAAELAASPKS